MKTEEKCCEIKDDSELMSLSATQCASTNVFVRLKKSGTCNSPGYLLVVSEQLFTAVIRQFAERYNWQPDVRDDGY